MPPHKTLLFSVVNRTVNVRANSPCVPNFLHGLNGHITTVHRKSEWWSATPFSMLWRWSVRLWNDFHICRCDFLWAIWKRAFWTSCPKEAKKSVLSSIWKLPNHRCCCCMPYTSASLPRRFLREWKWEKGVWKSKERRSIENRSSERQQKT